MGLAFFLNQRRVDAESPQSLRGGSAGPCRPLEVLSGDDGFTVASHARWLKARDYACLLDAEGAVDAAREHAARLRQQAQDDADEMRAMACERGLQEGRAKAAEEMAAMVVQATLVLRQLEPVIARAVTVVLDGMVQELPTSRLYEAALRKAARALRSEALVALRVPPEREAAARQALEALLAAGDLQGTVDVVPDAHLPDLGCVLESEAGSVSAGLDVQLDAIRRAVAREMARLTADAAGSAGREGAADK